MNANDSLFYTSLYTFLGGFILAVCGLLYKSKCKKFKFCGCEVIRDTEIELRQDIGIQNQLRSQSVDRSPV